MILTMYIVHCTQYISQIVEQYYLCTIYTYGIHCTYFLYCIQYIVHCTYHIQYSNTISVQFTLIVSLYRVHILQTQTTSYIRTFSFSAPCKYQCNFIISILLNLHSILTLTRPTTGSLGLVKVNSDSPLHLYTPILTLHLTPHVVTFN